MRNIEFFQKSGEFINIELCLFRTFWSHCKPKFYRTATYSTYDISCLTDYMYDSFTACLYNRIHYCYNHNISSPKHLF